MYLRELDTEYAPCYTLARRWTEMKPIVSVLLLCILWVGLQRAVIERVKRNVGVTREVKSEEVFDSLICSRPSRSWTAAAGAPDVKRRRERLCASVFTRAQAI